ncbi:hypothetical protein VHEMI08559 [[Torrubiella] hemipterigena]|uniref:Uncharacterized protein n=1 Tax=[Torrubiella] hemipterigena TaxID=1531966 RepID=A0A0A1TNN7_9HYPO|nr:hypothetical protein VHEMI08559 [[Torrubiella] hemipterigena]
MTQNSTTISQVPWRGIQVHIPIRGGRPHYQTRETTESNLHSDAPSKQHHVAGYPSTPNSRKRKQEDPERGIRSKRSIRAVNPQEIDEVDDFSEPLTPPPSERKMAQVRIRDLETLGGGLRDYELEEQIPTFTQDQQDTRAILYPSDQRTSILAAGTTNSELMGAWEKCMHCSIDNLDGTIDLDIPGLLRDSDEIGAFEKSSSFDVSLNLHSLERVWKQNWDAGQNAKTR